MEVVAFCTAQNYDAMVSEIYAFIESITNSFDLNLIMNEADESTQADDDDDGGGVGSCWWQKRLNHKTMKFNSIFHLWNRKN